MKTAERRQWSLVVANGAQKPSWCCNSALLNHLGLTQPRCPVEIRQLDTRIHSCQLPMAFADRGRRKTYFGKETAHDISAVIAVVLLGLLLLHWIRILLILVLRRSGVVLWLIAVTRFRLICDRSYPLRRDSRVVIVVVVAIVIVLLLLLRRCLLVVGLRD